MKQVLTINRKVVKKLIEIEARVDGHDDAIKSLVQTLHDLLTPVLPSKRRRIGLK